MVQHRPRVEIKNKHFCFFGKEKVDVFVVNDANKNHFLIIESAEKQDFNLFSSKSFAITTVIGYLTGHYAGDQGYFFASIRKKSPFNHLRYLSLRKSILSQFRPVNANPYSYLYNDRVTAKKYMSILRPITFREFSFLCEKAFNSLDFSSALILILESSVTSLVFMPGGYAIAIESLSNLIIGAKKLKLSPIKGKNRSQKIHKELHMVLDRYSVGISEDDLLILRKRISQINSKTNSARLRAPFELLGIKLNQGDLDILSTRNDFLHGRFPDLNKKKNNRSIKEIDQELYFVALKFYTLINLLVLKWAGYDSAIPNYPKLRELSTGIKLNEEPFRKV